MTRRSEKVYLEARKLYGHAERASRTGRAGDTRDSIFERAATGFREALKILESVHDQWSDHHYKLAFDILYDYRELLIGHGYNDVAADCLKLMEVYHREHPLSDNQYFRDNSQFTYALKFDLDALNKKVAALETELQQLKNPRQSARLFDKRQREDRDGNIKEQFSAKKSRI